jgi:hypothetical protein
MIFLLVLFSGVHLFCNMVRSVCLQALDLSVVVVFFVQALSGSSLCKWFVVVLGGQIVTRSCLMLLIA